MIESFDNLIKYIKCNIPSHNGANRVTCLTFPADQTVADGTRSILHDEEQVLQLPPLHHRL